MTEDKTENKKRVTLSYEAEAVIAEIKDLTRAKSLSEATETMISLYGDIVLSDLRAIKNGRGIRTQQQPEPPQSVSPQMKIRKSKQATTEAMDF